MKDSKKDNKRIVAVDIGGTLTKLAFTLPDETTEEFKEELKKCQSIKEAKGTSSVYLRRSKTDRIQDLIDFIKSKIQTKE